MAIDSAASLLFEIKANPDDATENISRFRSLLSTDLGSLKTQIASWSEEVFGEMESVRTAMLGITAAAAGALLGLGAALFETAKKAAEMGEEMGNLAQTSGIPVKTLSGLKVIADEAGISFDTLTSASVMMTRQLSPVASSSSTAGKALQMLGLSAYDSKGHMKDTVEIMAEVADKFKGMKDGAEKTALAQSIFSRSGALLIPILDQGGEALRNAADKANTLGLAFDDLSVQKSREFLEKMRDAKYALSGIGVSIGQELMPVFVEALNGVANFVESSSSDIRDFAGGMGSVLTWIGKIAEGIWDTFQALGKSVSFLVFEAMEAASVMGAVARGHLAEAKDDLTLMRLGWSDYARQMDAVFSNLASSSQDAIGHFVALGKSLNGPINGTHAAAAAADKLAASLASVRQEMQSLQDQQSKPQAAIEAQYQRSLAAAKAEIEATRARVKGGKLSTDELVKQESEYNEEVADLGQVRILKLEALEKQRVDKVAQLDQELQTKLQTTDQTTLAARLAAVNAEVAAEAKKYQTLGALDEQHEQMLLQLREQLTAKAVQAQAQQQDKELKNFEDHYKRLEQITTSYQQKSLTGAARIRQAYLDEVAAIKAQEAETLKLAATDAQRAQVVEQTSRAIAAARQDELRQLQQLDQHQQRFGASTQQLYNQLDSALQKHSRVVGEVVQQVVKALAESLAAHRAEAAGAMEASTAKTVAQGKEVGQVSVWQGAMNMAKGLADLADWNWSGAAKHFAAAGEFIALAGSVGMAVAGMLSGGGSSSAAGSTAVAAASNTASQSTASASGNSSATPATNVYITVQGALVSPDTLSQITNQISQSVSSGQNTLTASHLSINGATVPAGAAA